MSNIGRTFSILKEKKERALIPYVCCGDPNLAFTEELVLRMSNSGADIIELGIPYSDPVADGPTIQKAAQRALAGGVKIDQLFEMVVSLRKKTSIPLVFMTYYNPIYRYGLDKFVQKAAQAGIDGFIVPDLPPEEAEELEQATAAAGIDLIFLVAPTSTEARIKMIGERSRGFVYCVADTGVTGSRDKIAEGLDEFIKKVRVLTDMPLAVGFGVSSGEMARQIGKNADGVIVGSSIIERMERQQEALKSSPDKVTAEIACYIKELKAAIRE